MKNKKEAKKNTSPEQDNGRLCAILAYFFVGIIWYFLDEKLKKNDFAKFHVKQGLVLLIADLILMVINNLPILGFIGLILGIILLVIWIIGLVNVINNQQKEVPIIGQFARKFSF